MGKNYQKKLKEFHQAADELIVARKLDRYRDYLDNLDAENLGFEFNDRMGCDPEDYYTNAIHVHRRQEHIDDLVEDFDVALYSDPEADWVNNTRYLESIKEVECVLCGDQVKGSQATKREGRYICHICVRAEADQDGSDMYNANKNDQ